MSVRAVVAAVVVLLGTAMPAVAQSIYVPIDDPATTLIEALLNRGHLRQLRTLERPWTVSEVKAALDEASMDDNAAVDGWRQRLEGALRRLSVPAVDEADSGSVGVRLELMPVLVLQTMAARDVMIGDDSAEGPQPGGEARLIMGAGNVAAVSRIVGGRQLKFDPAFHGRNDRVISARAEDAYVRGEWRWGEVALGRTARSWGPPPLAGLQIGDAPFTYDHVFGRIGGRRFWLSSMVARLDDLEFGAGPDSLARRWMSAHRFGVHLGALEVGLGEAVVYGGPGRQLEWSMANPLGMFQLAQYEETGDGNVSYTADVSWRWSSGMRWAAQVLIDDIQLDECDPNCDEPPSYGVAAVLEGLPLLRAHRGFASYTRVTNLAYRAPLAWERWSFHAYPLGRLTSDFDEIRLGADLAITAAGPIRVYAGYRRQGQGSFAIPYPQPSEFGATPTFLAGTVEKTLRVALSGTLAFSILEMDGDVGLNRSSNFRHMPGWDKNEFEGRLSARVRLGASFSP